MSSSAVEGLLEFLFRNEETVARKLADDMRQVGLSTPMKYGVDAPQDTAASPDQTRRRAEVLIALGRASLERAVDGYENIRQIIEHRIRRARRLKLTAAVMTTILASGVVASLKISPDSPWGIIIGGLAMAASVLTIIATFLEGGDLKLAEKFAEVAAKTAEARSLLERLAAYAKEPEMFEDDVNNRLGEAEQLAVFLEVEIARWRTS